VTVRWGLVEDRVRPGKAGGRRLDSKTDSTPVAISGDRARPREDDDQIHWRSLQARYCEGLARAGVDTNGATIKDEPSPGSKQKFAAAGDKHRCQNIDLK